MQHYDISTLKSTQAPDLLLLASQLTTLKRTSSSGGGEFSGPCPFCGGKDRFCVQPHHTPEPRWLCRKCTDGVWKDIINFVEYRDKLPFMDAVKALFGDSVQLAPEALEKLRAERDERIAQQQASEQAELERRRADLNRSGVWSEYWQNLDKMNMRGLWHARGLSDLWIDYFQVGYCPERTFGHEDGYFRSPTLTIPTFRAVMGGENPEGRALTWNCAQLVHRLLIDNPPGGKYRPHLSGCGKPLFRADLYAPIHGDVLLVEGEIKAMVTWAHIQDYVYSYPLERSILGRLQVVGTAGQGFKRESAAELVQAERIWICLDPDTWVKPKGAPKGWLPAPARVAKILGPERCRIIQLGDKIDDMLNAGTLDAGDLPGLMATAKGVL